MPCICRILPSSIARKCWFCLDGRPGFRNCLWVLFICAYISVKRADGDLHHTLCILNVLFFSTSPRKAKVKKEPPATHTTDGNVKRFYEVQCYHVGDAKMDGEKTKRLWWIFQMYFHPFFTSGILKIHLLEWQIIRKFTRIIRLIFPPLIFTFVHLSFSPRQFICSPRNLKWTNSMSGKPCLLTAPGAPLKH